MNLTMIGLIFTAIGALILLLNNLLTGWHQKINGQPMNKTYWWMGRRPIYKNTETLKWKIKWNRKVIVYGIIPPRYFWEIVGFFCILIGTILQIISQ
jgi:hypothetical protein